LFFSNKINLIFEKVTGYHFQTGLQKHTGLILPFDVCWEFDFRSGKEKAGHGIAHL
jgi:hypothetical protein